MKYTDKEYYISEYLRDKLDLMVERVVKHKFDNLIIVDGDEGYGKSNIATAVSYYLAWKSGRTFTINNIFFLIDDMINFAVANEKETLLWDESALGALASESYSKVQTKLLKLLMVARKKNHYYVFVIPKFFRLREAIIDRAIGLIHVYSRDQITRGRFAYYRKESKEKMYQYWRATKFKPYKQYYDFLGTFGETLPLIIDEKEYDRRKDAAIMTLSSTNDGKNDEIERVNAQMKKLQATVASIDVISQVELAKKLGISRRTLQYWKKQHISVPYAPPSANAGAQAILIKEVNPLLDGDDVEPSIDTITDPIITFDDDASDTIAPITIADDQEEP